MIGNAGESGRSPVKAAMQTEIRSALERLLNGESLDQEEMRQAIGAVMDGRCSEIEIAALLTALAVSGETEIEVAGAAEAMRERAARIETSRTGLLDTCGTGGDRLHTFNISTATALVAAACGVPVAKHGNRSVSSSSGSADVLEELGVNIELTPQQAGRCLDELGICFCYARLFHGAMKHVAPVRGELGFRTIFNLLGPLTNPAGAEYQLLGANRNASAEKIARAAGRLGIQRAFVVCGNDQLDEVALWGETRVWDVSGDEGNGPTTANSQQPTANSHQPDVLTWTPEDFGLPPCQPEDLRVTSAAESAAVIRGVLEGKPGPARDMVLANVAAALLCRGEVESLPSGVARGAEAIDRGNASRLLDELARWSRSAT
jgi:anthranilate phosphoribosyltransferase